MQTNWTRHWEENYGNFSWKIWAWRLSRAYKKLLKNVQLGKNPKILELGAGTGINSVLLAGIAKADKIVLVDFNKKASGICKSIIKDYKNSGNKVDIEYINKNVLDLSLKNLNKKFDTSKMLNGKSIFDSAQKLKYASRQLRVFDIMHSEGLIEHFYGKERIAVFKKHAELCNKNGLIIIFVPCKSIAYSLNKLLHKILGKWIWDEVPFSRQELHSLCKKFNLQILKEYSSPFFQEIGILARKKN